MVRVSHTRGMPYPDLNTFLEIHGKQAAVAAALGVSRQTVNDWKRNGFVPSRHAVAFEGLSGIPRGVLCPKFEWGLAPKRKAKLQEVA